MTGEAEASSPANLIGHIKCLVCRNPRARLTVTKSGLAATTCNACNFQGFARSDHSDRLMRDQLLTPAPSVPEPVPAPTPPSPERVPEPPPKAKPRGFLLG